jgi:hypothetical protein
MQWLVASRLIQQQFSENVMLGILRVLSGGALLTD